MIFHEKDVERIEWGLLAKQVCSRNFGIGADGMIIARQKPLEMMFFNQDGSKAPMCGNGLRCFAKFAVSEKLAEMEHFPVKTGGGEMKVKVSGLVEINLGAPCFKTSEIPAIYHHEELLDRIVRIDERELRISAVFLGTSHCVVFSDPEDEIAEEDIGIIGPLLENYYIFPEKINVNFCTRISREKLRVRTWERGVGRTLACGTGASASFAIARRLGYVEEEVEAKLPGGTLILRDQGGEIHMMGGADLVARGEYIYRNEEKL